ncbi:hypothetical protein DQ353_13435 [Arthrobacter sp. AQ5-05]|uniref:hypothetical protein n=1 Tax=Arthrobacter sp. AQ5-05 TaxID=2184581 RepID=UPI000DCD9BE0|nr:hypothetical protein [Arthrobacter sp. AQ5-05]RAX48729.1 hypothetical protein DQ353_13435 [Arthrobacter sp. AQ5-05]
MRLLQKTMPLGEDILLARHGSSIVEMTQDRKNNLTRARLVDGSTDTASNFLVSLNAMAATTPAERFTKVAGDYSADRLPVSRQEIRFMAKVTGIWAVASTAFIGALGWVIFNYGDHESLVGMMGTTF